MSLVKFNDRTFLDYKGNWFVWEPCWEGFRPVEAMEWDGYTYRIVDGSYCSDPSDVFYGYGSEKMKQVCEALAPLYKDNAVTTDRLAIGPSEWFRDRRVTLSPCAPRDKESWKRMCRGRVHTCRREQPVRNKFTRRNLRH
jgi:hypothetical protein